MKKLFLSFVVIIGISILFSSCHKDGDVKDPTYLVSGGTYSATPEYGGNMKTFIATTAFSYCSNESVSMYIKVPKNGSEYNFELFDEYSCSSASHSSAKHDVGDTIYVYIANNKTVWFKGLISTDVKIVGMD